MDTLVLMNGYFSLEALLFVSALAKETLQKSPFLRRLEKNQPFHHVEHFVEPTLEGGEDIPMRRPVLMDTKEVGDL